MRPVALVLTRQPLPLIAAFVRAAHPAPRVTTGITMLVDAISPRLPE